MSKTYSLKGKVSREVALVVAEELVGKLPDTQIVGSLRRGCEIIGDVDLLTTSQEAMGLFPMLVDEVFVKGEAKVSARKGGIQVDLNFTTVEAMGSALLHHTGSAQFNVFTRSRAKRQGYTLSQHGLPSRRRSSAAMSALGGYVSLRKKAPSYRLSALGRLDHRDPGRRPSEERLLRRAERRGHAATQEREDSGVH